MKKHSSVLLQSAPGALAGLFLARVALEATRRPCPAALVLAAGLVGALAGFALARRLSRHSPSWAILVIYVLWPGRDLLVAAGVATLAALTWLLSIAPPSLSRWAKPLAKWAEPLTDGAIWVVALVAYVATVSPDVLPADAGEFQLATALLGVAHPPGYPLYTMVGHLFIRLVPLGTPAYRLNLLSALLAAGTLVLVARATRLWAKKLGASPRTAIAGGLVAALALGTATTFWAQATIANVRTPAVFLAAMALYALARFAAAPAESNRPLFLLALALGLGGGHYPPLAFVAIFFIVYAVLVDTRLAMQPRRWWRPALVGLAAFLLPLAYLPIRGAMGAPLAPDNLHTPQGFLQHFLARGFAGDMFAFANAADLPHRLALLPTLLPFQFNVALLVAALLGMLGLIWRDWRLSIMLIGSLLLHTFVTITYRAPQTVEYMMPAYLPIAVAVGLLPALPLPHSLAPPPLRFFVPPLLCAFTLWIGLLNGWSHAPSFAELAQDRSTRQTVEPLLEQAPKGALLLADWRWYTPLRYLQDVEGVRPDVYMQYVWPEAGKEYRDVWLARIQNADAGQSVLLTHFYEFPGYTTEPWESGFLIRPRPVAEPEAPLTLVGAAFGEQVHLVGYRLQKDHLGLGQAAEVVLAWRPTRALDRPPSFTLRLVDENGQHVAQADQSLSTDVAPGEVRFERLTLSLYPMLPPGRYRVVLGAYVVTDAGFENLTTPAGETTMTLTELALDPPVRRPFTLHRLTIPFAGGPTLVGPTLVGVDYDRSVPDVLRVYLYWQGPSKGGEQIRVWTGDSIEAVSSLPAIPAGAYQTVALDLPGTGNGPLRLTLSDAEAAAVAATAWGWPTASIRSPNPRPDARFVPLGDEMVVTGVKAHPAAPGETMAIDVTLLSLRPLTSDDSTSVRLLGADGQWLGTHDSQPALGAVPTLKWIAGSRVVDRHLLAVPEDFAGETVQATLVAYERFGVTQLRPMDGRFDQVPLGTWPQPKD